MPDASKAKKSLSFEVEKRETERLIILCFARKLNDAENFIFQPLHPYFKPWNLLCFINAIIKTLNCQANTIQYFVTESGALRLIKVVVPEYIYLNKPASLECQYDLENDKLYTVQWYKDNDEFYRYVPKYFPPHISYRIDDIKVDVSISSK